MGLRIERADNESITICEPNGDTTMLTRNDKMLDLVEWKQGRRSVRSIAWRMNSIMPITPTTTLRVRSSRRGVDYLSFMLYAPESVVIYRTEEPRTVGTLHRRSN